MSPETLPPFRYRQPQITGVEDVEKYVPGGYHPVDIGDVIRAGEQSYQVIHKLGHGGFSTVWLVRDCAHSSSHFALKILCAGVVEGGELNILQHLGKVAGPGHPNVLALCSSFQISGPNGQHQCLVLPVLGPSLENTKVVAALAGSTRHQVCQQVASAVSFLHHHGVCHGGKLNSSFPTLALDWLLLIHTNIFWQTLLHLTLHSSFQIFSLCLQLRYANF